MSDKPRKLYVPPARKAVERLVRDACNELARRGETAYAKPEVVTGLSEFLYFVGQLSAKYLNAGLDDPLDNSH